MSFDTLSQSPLTGQFVTLLPLKSDHAAALFQALDGDEELWRYIPVPQPALVEEMEGWIESTLEEQREGHRIPYAVIENAGGTVIGSTSYVNLSQPNPSLDIGWTWYARSHWRTPVNTECKFLLLRHAFETLGCIRVQLRVDERNLRSQRAIERLGAVREGMLRKVQILYDGHHRNVVIYSVLDEEWQERRVWFERQLAR